MMQDTADDVVFIHGVQGDLQTCLVGIADFVHRAVQVDAGGTIEGDEHLAAWTCGDGACALHAIFGVPSARSGEVSSPGARASIAEGLPETLAAFSTAPCAYLRASALGLLKTMWEEAVIPAARSLVHNSDLLLVREEARIV